MTSPNAFLSDESARRVRNAELDERMAQFVELLNARDLDALGGLLAPDVEAAFLEEASRGGLIEGLEDLLVRYPTLVVTRGDLADGPIVAAWLFDDREDRYDLVGYFAIELADFGDRLIRRVEYVEEVESEDLVVEMPELAELPEWEDWTTQEEG